MFMQLSSVFIHDHVFTVVQARAVFSISTDCFLFAFEARNRWRDRWCCSTITCKKQPPCLNVIIVATFCEQDERKRKRQSSIPSARLLCETDPTVQYDLRSCSHAVGRFPPPLFDPPINARGHSGDGRL